MIRATVTLGGAKQLQAKLRAMDRKMRAKTLSTAAREGSKVIGERARELAPRDSGELAGRGIKVRVTKRSQFYGEAAVGHDRRHFYGIFQELGVAAHPQGKGKHPGHRAQPHLRPAFDEKNDEAERVTAEELRKALMTVVR